MLARPDLPFLAAWLALLCVLTFSYRHHFDNEFHFDDMHTIVNNTYITSLDNIPRFFTDARTGSSLPTNQSYRPVVATLNAIDYWLAGKLDPFYFRLHIFVEFLLLCVLLFFVFLAVFDLARQRRENRWLALLGVAFFALHTATAETLNYIIARSDGFSTLCVLGAFVIYCYSRGSWRHLCVIPFAIGIFAKPTALMYAPLLVVYVAVVEKPSMFIAAETPGVGVGLRRIGLATFPYLLLAVALYLFTRSMYASTWTPSDTQWFDYLITQPYVCWIYLNTFLVPTELTADTDLALIHDPLDVRVLFGLMVVASTLALALFGARQRHTVPVAFGILWFYIALIPSSSVVPLSEVMNHHRTFFPYIGLVMSVTWGFGLLYGARRRSVLATWVVAGACCAFLSIHAYGASLRVAVWDNDESLWYDVTLKSPRNGRGLMNYGLSQMQRGNVAAAIDYFERALGTSYRNHAYLHTNLGIAYSASGDQGKAEQHFSIALANGPRFPATHYYYAQWLHEQGRNEQALAATERALALSPGHREAARLREALLADAARAREIAGERRAGESAANEYIQLSLEHYNAQRFEESVAASQQALRFRANATAYNNLCAAYNRLGRHDDAIAACSKALALRPDFELARGNLDSAMRNKQAARN